MKLLFFKKSNDIQVDMQADVKSDHVVFEYYFE